MRTQFTIDGRNFFGISAAHRRHGAIEVGGKHFLISPTCFETAEPATGCPEVAWIGNLVREASAVEVAFLRGTGADLTSRPTGGLE